jgi:hypothetical protein
MSILSDIYISRDDEAVKYDTAPDQFSDRAQYNGMTPLELSTLWAILRGVKWDWDSQKEFACLPQVAGGERLVHRLPAAMVAELAKLPTERIASATKAWAATEELDCSPEDIKPVVEALVRLACLAVESGRSIYLWNCV